MGCNEQSLHDLAHDDASIVYDKNIQYGESWCKRGGQQAFAVIWRKVDRIESIMSQMANGYDIFEAWDKNPGDVRDDIRDLRQYLLLLEERMIRFPEAGSGLRKEDLPTSRSPGDQQRAGMGVETPPDSHD
jgi:hypothetical protein